MYLRKKTPPGNGLLIWEGAVRETAVSFITNIDLAEHTHEIQIFSNFRKKRRK